MTDNAKCFFCGQPVIYGGDHDLEGNGLHCDKYEIESNFSCPNCQAFYLVTHDLAEKT